MVILFFHENFCKNRKINFLPIFTWCFSSTCQQIEENVQLLWLRYVKNVILYDLTVRNCYLLAGFLAVLILQPIFCCFQVFLKNSIFSIIWPHFRFIHAQILNFFQSIYSAILDITFRNPTSKWAITTEILETCQNKQLHPAITLSAFQQVFLMF